MLLCNEMTLCDKMTVWQCCCVTKWLCDYDNVAMWWDDCVTGQLSTSNTLNWVYGHKNLGPHNTTKDRFEDMWTELNLKLLHSMDRGTNLQRPPVHKHGWATLTDYCGDNGDGAANKIWSQKSLGTCLWLCEWMHYLSLFAMHHYLRFKTQHAKSNSDISNTSLHIFHNDLSDKPLFVSFINVSTATTTH